MKGNEIDQLISLLARVPGLGPRSAKRATLHLIKKRDSQLVPLIRAMQDVLTNVKTCNICGNLDTKDPCSICSDLKRDQSSVCIVQDIADLWALERSGTFKGHYHVLGGLLSAIDGIGPEELNLDKLLNKVKEGKVLEVIIALPVTVEGQTTCHYIADCLKEYGIKVYTLAQGVPVGGELDYLDDGTIQAAIKAKKAL